MSFILSQIIKKKIPKWNSQVFTDSEVDNICAKQRVRIIENNFKAKGEYLIQGNYCFILIKKNLPRREKLWIALHELGHHLLHFPVPHKFSKSLIRRMDREANYFASIALMPTQLITQKTFGEIIEEYNYPKELIEIRKEIFEVFKI